MPTTDGTALTDAGHQLTAAHGGTGGADSALRSVGCTHPDRVPRRGWGLLPRAAKSRPSVRPRSQVSYVSWLSPCLVSTAGQSLHLLPSGVPCGRIPISRAKQGVCFRVRGTPRSIHASASSASARHHLRVTGSPSGNATISDGSGASRTMPRTMLGPVRLGCESRRPDFSRRRDAPL